MEHEKKYTVYQLRETEGCSIVCMTDCPKTAITTWFETIKKYPMMVSITAISKQDAEFLIDYAQLRKDVIKELHKEHSCGYELDYLLEQIQKKFNDRCRGFLGYGDQIHPFCLG